MPPTNPRDEAETILLAMGGIVNPDGTGRKVFVFYGSPGLTPDLIEAALRKRDEKIAEVLGALNFLQRRTARIRRLLLDGPERENVDTEELAREVRNECATARTKADSAVRASMKSYLRAEKAEAELDRAVAALREWKLVAHFLALTPESKERLGGRLANVIRFTEEILTPTPTGAAEGEERKK